jgi:hypothetical protein
LSDLSPRDIEHIFERLRGGLVPERGLTAFAVGIEDNRAELHRQLELISRGEGSIKFLRGGYGGGKTFMARLAILDAQAKGYATSFVVVSDNDLRFHKFEEVYRKIVSELGTATCPRGALGDLLDRWIGRIEAALVAAGANEDAPDFDERVRQRLGEEINSLTRGQAPQDFVRVVQAIFDAKQANDFATAGSLLSWLSGSANVAATAKKLAGVKGDIGSSVAMDYLRGVLEIVKAAGYHGLLIVIDEAETILRMRTDTRHKSLNGIRQIADDVSTYPGLLWLFTGTPDFFDSRRGVQGLEPLHDRIKFSKTGNFASRKQPQLELHPFDRERLLGVAKKLRGLFPAIHAARVAERMGDAFLHRLVDEVTTGFRGDVGVVPRQFLREFVNQLDLVDQEQTYDPMQEYGFKPQELRPEEREVLHGKAAFEDEDVGLVPKEDVW